MIENLKKSIAMLLSATTVMMTSLDALLPELSAIAAEISAFETENKIENSDSEVTETTFESSKNESESETTVEEQIENNSVQEYNSNYAVYANNIAGDGSISNPYQIENAEQLYWFANKVNSGNISINAILTADIVVNTNVLNADGTLNADLTNPREWTPIGIDESNVYNGTFDGQNHTISGLYLNNENAEYVGLFGYNNNGGTIKNVGISDSYFNGKKYVGGVCGYNSGTITNVYNTGSVSGSKDIGGVCGHSYGSGTITNSYNTGSVSGLEDIGGVCGYNYENGIIANVYNTGSISGSKSESSGYVGGVCGYSFGNSKLTNSYNTGSVSGTHYVGGIFGCNNGTIENSYNTGSVSGSELVGGFCGENNGTITNSYYLENCNAEGITFDSKEGTEKTAEQFENGEIAYLLQGEQETEIWGQEIEKDNFPIFNGKKVYANKTYSGCCEKYQGDVIYDYSNTQADAVYLKQAHNFENGICTACRAAYELIEAPLKDGYYQISNIGNLYWFANEVNNGNKSINAVLTADIVVNENVLNADGTLNTALTNPIEWTPIGNASNKYQGTFDGQNHTISGLYFNDESTKYIGLFGFNSGKIKNIGIVDSYFKGKERVGGLCGYNYGTITNVYNAGSVSGSEYVGGICGYNQNKGGIISNCYNAGKINGRYAGSLCGENLYGTISNCYYDISYNSNDVGSNYGTITDDVLGKSSEEFASGEVAYLLQGEQTESVWGQKLGTNKTPVLNGEKVYANKTYSGCCEKNQGDVTSCKYSNTQADAVYLKETHNFENGICTACGAYELIEAPLKDGYYQISNANHLYWFAEQVKNNSKLCAVLTADIVVNENVLNADGTLNANLKNPIEWTPIGIDESNVYNGTFDGQNHTISGLYFNDESTKYVGLFGCNSGTIKNVGIVDSYFYGKSYVGSICGLNNGTIENIYNTGSASGSSNSYYVSGICGLNYGTITNSYNTGSVSGSEDVGGVCGYNNNGKIANSYNTGSVSGSVETGGMCGKNFGNGTITNSYYLENCNAEGTTFDSKEGTEKTAEQFKNGEVAYLLQGEQKTEIWGQEIEKDNSPVLNGKKVYKNTKYSGCCEKNQGDVVSYEYSNIQKAIYLKQAHNFENGICTACGAYELIEAPLKDGYYQISNANHLYWFAEQVKNNSKLCAVLTADIIVNENVLNDDGTLNTALTNPIEWTPIGIDESNVYNGTFDGQNHTISGLYFNDENSDYVGFIGCNSSGTIKNIGIVDSYFNGKKYVGCISGYNNGGKIENSYNASKVSGSEYVGGICGYNYYTITNCYNTGTVNGSNRVGGICGYNQNQGGTISNCYISNCYNAGKINGRYAGSLCGENFHGTISNCYYDISYNSNDVGSNYGTITDDVLGKSSEEFASGEVAYLLQGEQETEIWGQEIEKDNSPVLNGKKVYANKTYSGCCEKNQGDITSCKYSNTQADAVYLKETHNFEDGICTACRAAYELIEAPLKDGYYQISNANHLYWFANEVNSGNKSINAVLTADIVVNENVLNADGTLNANLKNPVEWTPIGNDSIAYQGTFDGQNHTISGLYFNNKNTDYVGLFGYNSGKIKNVGIVDSYFNGEYHVGGVCGFNEGGTIENTYNAGSVSGSYNIGGVCGSNNYTIENSYNTGSVSGSYNVGGVCGYNDGTIENSYNTVSVSGSSDVGGVCGDNYGTIENSYNTGSVSGSENYSYVGGVCGDNYGTIENCYNTGSVSDSENYSYVGGVCGDNPYGTIENSYYLENCNAEGTTFTCNAGTEKTAEQFENGELAYLLQGEQKTEIWGQKLGTDKTPVLNGENKVYKITAYLAVESEITSEMYINKSGTITAPIKEGYNFDGWYVYDENSENHYTGDSICSSREYNLTVNSDSKIVAVYKPLGTANITINCDKEYTINGISKASETSESYSIGSKITLSCSDENFAYWQNSAGTVLSRESEYSFVVTGDETISAIFNEVVDNKVTLTFESFYGQVIATKQLGNGETMDIPELPIRTGYNAIGWDFDGDGKFTENDTLENAIESGLKLDSKTVKIVPIYKLIEKTYNITVENGEGSGEYNQNDIVTATANEAETGMKFSHWEDSDGNILSYNEKYVFYASSDITVKAVYVATEIKIDAKGTTDIVGFSKTTNNKLSFVSMSTVPEGCKINKAGIIATNDSSVGTSEDFTDKTAKFVRGISSEKTAVRYTWTKGKVQSGETWYVRAYLVYTDSNGNVHTVYGDTVSQTY